MLLVMLITDIKTFKLKYAGILVLLFAMPTISISLPQPHQNIPVTKCIPQVERAFPASFYIPSRPKEVIIPFISDSEDDSSRLLPSLGRGEAMISHFQVWD